MKGQVVDKKIKTKLFLCLTKYHFMKAYCGSGGIVHAFLTSALDGGGWSASRSGFFILKERAPATHWIGGWVGPSAGMNPVVGREISSPCRVWNP
jgi:hypothetical protein